VAEAAFGGGAVEDPVVLAELYQELGGFAIPVPSDGSAVTAAGTATASGLFASNSEIRRSISQGGLTINGRRVGAADEAVEAIADRWYVVRSGKRRLAVGRREG
jgi:tyrosyl-tRNA synthetase